MRWIFLAVLPLMLMACPMALALSLQDLKAKYSKLSGITADITQTKTGKKFKRPLVSEVRLTSTDGAVLWDVVKPIKARLSMTAHDVSIQSSSDSPPQILNTQESAPLAALMQFIRALASGDFVHLEKSFSLSLNDYVLRGVPHPLAQLSFIESFDLKFSADGQIERLEVRATDEKTVLEFRNVILQSQLAAPGK